MSCTVPSPLPNGYVTSDSWGDISSVQENLEFANLANPNGEIVSNLQCADGYAGIPIVVQCDPPTNSDFSVTGCERTCPPLRETTDPYYRSIDEIFEDRYDLNIGRATIDRWIQNYINWKGLTSSARYLHYNAIGDIYVMPPSGSTHPGERIAPYGTVEEAHKGYDLGCMEDNDFNQDFNTYGTILEQASQFCTNDVDINAVPGAPCNAFYREVLGAARVDSPRTDDQKANSNAICFKSLAEGEFVRAVPDLESHGGILRAAVRSNESGLYINEPTVATINGINDNTFYFYPQVGYAVTETGRSLMSNSEGVRADSDENWTLMDSVLRERMYASAGNRNQNGEWERTCPRTVADLERTSGGDVADFMADSVTLDDRVTHMKDIGCLDYLEMAFNSCSSGESGICNIHSRTSHLPDGAGCFPEAGACNSFFIHNNNASTSTGSPVSNGGISGWPQDQPNLGRPGSYGINTVINPNEITGAEFIGLGGPGGTEGVSGDRGSLVDGPLDAPYQHMGTQFPELSLNNSADWNNSGFYIRASTANSLETTGLYIPSTSSSTPLNMDSYRGRIFRENVVDFDASLNITPQDAIDFITDDETPGTNPYSSDFRSRLSSDSDTLLIAGTWDTATTEAKQNLVIELITAHCEITEGEELCSIASSDGTRSSLFNPNYEYPNQEFINWNDTGDSPFIEARRPACTGDDDGSGTPASCGASDSADSADTAACADIVGADLDDETACENTMTVADSMVRACTYTAQVPGDTCTLNADGSACEFGQDTGHCVYDPAGQLLDHSELFDLERKNRYDRYLDRLYEHMETQEWSDEAISSTTGHPEDVGHGDGITPSTDNLDFVTSLKNTNYNFDSNYQYPVGTGPAGTGGRYPNRHYYFKAGDFGLRSSGFTNDYWDNGGTIHTLLGGSGDSTEAGFQPRRHIYDAYIGDYIDLINPKFTNYEGVEQGTVANETYFNNLQTAEIKPKHNSELKKCKPFIKYTSRNDHLEGTYAEDGIHEEIEKTKYLGVVNSFIRPEGSRPNSSVSVDFDNQNTVWKQIAEKYGIDTSPAEQLYSVTDIPSMNDTGASAPGDRLNTSRRKLLKKTEYYLKKIGEISKPSISAFYYEPINIHNFITPDTGRYASDDLTYHFITNYFHKLADEDHDLLSNDEDAQNFLLRKPTVQLDNTDLYQRVSRFGTESSTPYNLCNLTQENSYKDWLRTHDQIVLPAWALACTPMHNYLSPYIFGSGQQFGHVNTNRRTVLDSRTDQPSIAGGYERAANPNGLMDLHQAPHGLSAWEVTNTHGRIFPRPISGKTTSKRDPFHLMSEITRRNILKLRDTQDKNKYFIRWNSWYHPKDGDGRPVENVDTYRPLPESHFAGMQDRIDTNTNRVHLRSFRKANQPQDSAFFDPEMYQGVHFTIVQGLRPHEYASINIRSGVGDPPHVQTERSSQTNQKNIRYYFDQRRNEELLGYNTETLRVTGGTVFGPQVEGVAAPTGDMLALDIPHSDSTIKEKLVGTYLPAGQPDITKDKIKNRINNYYDYFYMKKNAGEEVEDFLYDLPGRAVGENISSNIGGGDSQAIQDEGVPFNYGCYIDSNPEEIDQYVKELAEDFVGQTTEEAAAYDVAQGDGTISFDYIPNQGNCAPGSDDRNSLITHAQGSTGWKNNSISWGNDTTEFTESCSDVLDSGRGAARGVEEADAGIDHKVIKLPLTATENLQRAKNSFKKVLLGFTNSIDIEVVNRYVLANLDSSNLSGVDKRQINLHKAPYRLGSIFSSGEVSNDWIDKAEAWMAQNPCEDDWGDGTTGACLIPEDSFDKYKKYDVNRDNLPSYLSNYETNYSIFMTNNIDTVTCSCNFHEKIINGECIPCEPNEVNNNIERITADAPDSGVCEPLVCPENTYFNSNNPHQCTPCGQTQTSTGGLPDACTERECGENQYAHNHQCTPCAPGMLSDAGTGGIETCSSDICNIDQYVNNNACVDCPNIGSNYSLESALQNAAGTNTFCNIPSAFQLGPNELILHKCDGEIQNSAYCYTHQSCIQNIADCTYENYSIEVSNVHFTRYYNDNTFSTELCSDILGRKYPGPTGNCSGGDFYDQSTCENDGHTWRDESYGSLTCSYEMDENDDQITADSDSDNRINPTNPPPQPNTNSTISPEDCRTAYSLMNVNSQCQIQNYNREYINIEPYMYENHSYTIRDNYKPIKQVITLDGQEITIEYVDLRTLSQRSGLTYLTNLSGISIMKDGQSVELVTSTLTDLDIENILTAQNGLISNVASLTIWPSSQTTQGGDFLYFIDSRDGPIHCPHPLLTGEPDTNNTGGDTTKYFFEEDDNNNYTCKPRTTTCGDGLPPTDNTIADNYDNQCDLNLICANSEPALALLIEGTRNFIEEDGNIFPTIDLNVNDLSYIFDNTQDLCILSNGMCPENKYRTCAEIDMGGECTGTYSEPHIWTLNPGSCSDGTSTDLTTCEEATHTWTAGSCSDVTYTDRTTCEATNTWTAGSCSDGTYTDQATCQAATHNWTAGSCSDVTYTDRTTCEATNTWTAESCSDGTYTDQATCQTANHTWTPNETRCTGSDDGSGSPATCGAIDSADNAACAAIVGADLDSSTACDAVTQADGSQICSYTAQVPGNACTLDGGGTGCAIPGGDCVFTQASGFCSNTSFINEVDCTTETGPTTTQNCPQSDDQVLCLSRGSCSYTSGTAICNLPLECLVCNVANLSDHISVHATAAGTRDNYVDNWLDFIICSNNPTEGIISSFDPPTNGRLLPEACADGFYLSSSDLCEPVSCVATGTTPQHVTLVTETLTYGDDFVQEFTCDDNYDGTIISTCGGNPVDSDGNIIIDYQGSCSPIICTQPTDTIGYDSIIETQLDLSSSSGFSVTAECATGYEGTASATACTTTGPYTLDGCTPITCTQPSDTIGYDSIIETQLDLSSPSGFSVTAECATGYEGTASAAACTTTGPYTLDGCTPIICGQPTDTIGYDSIIVTQLDLSSPSGFSVTANCATGYEGTPSATACNGNGEPYTLSGCTPIICSTPTDTSGYTINSESNLNLSAGSFSINAQCATGYTGSAVADECTTTGPYTLSGCVPELTCASQLATPPDGYTITNESLDTTSTDGFSITGSCADGYTGTLTATSCTTEGGDYTLSGCDLEIIQSCSATCTGSDDGTGTPCALNADESSCAVQGGDCVYTESLGEISCSLPTCGTPNSDGTCTTGCIVEVGTETTATCEGTGIVATATCIESATTSDATDAAACSGVTNLNDSTVCVAVMKASDSSSSACTYTAESTTPCALNSAGSGCELSGDGCTYTAPTQGDSTCIVDPNFSCAVTDGVCPSGCIFSCATAADTTQTGAMCTSPDLTTDTSIDLDSLVETNLSMDDFDVSLGCNLETHIGLPRITACTADGTPYTFDSSYCIPRNDPSVEETEVATEDYTLEIQSEVIFDGEPPPEGSTEADEFKESFINALLNQFPTLTRENITINEIKEGSTVVDYTISYPVSEGETPPSQEALQTVIQQADFTTLGYGSPVSVTVTKQAAPTRGYLFLGISFMVCVSVIALIVILMMKKKSE